jgi:alpha/beta hydrolase fold
MRIIKAAAVQLTPVLHSREGTVDTLCRQRFTMPHKINQLRRRFLGTAGMTLAAGRLGLFDVAHAQSGTTTQAAVTGTHTSFASLKQINAGPLNAGYAEAGPANGPAVMLLHGWPYDIHTYVDVAPLLAAKGYRVIVPHLRGYGSTSFLSTSTVRNGQQSVMLATSSR